MFALSNVAMILTYIAMRDPRSPSKTGGRRVRTFSVPDDTDLALRHYASEHQMTLSAVLVRALKRLTSR